MSHTTDGFFSYYYFKKKVSGKLTIT